MKEARSGNEKKKLGIKGGSLVEKGNGPGTTLISKKGLVNGPPMGPGSFNPKTRRPVSRNERDGK